MKSFQTFLPALLACLPTTLGYKPFSIPTLTTHQPNGNPDGQVNYYRIAFTVTSNSTNGTTSSGYCNKFWGDNSWLQLEAYSVNVPTDEWFTCDSSADNLGDQASDFQFQLFPYFSIGNFSVAVKEALGDGSRYVDIDVWGGGATCCADILLCSLQGFKHVTNQTDSYTCQINPIQVPYEQHAQGDCSIPDGKGPFLVPVSLS